MVIFRLITAQYRSYVYMYVCMLGSLALPGRSCWLGQLVCMCIYVCVYVCMYSYFSHYRAGLVLSLSVCMCVYAYVCMLISRE